MTTPRIEVDLNKLRQNTQTLVEQLSPHGIGVTGVTKASCGHPSVAQAMLDGGAAGLADSRLNNVERLRRAGFTGSITLIRTPMLSQAARVVQACETSYNTERVVIDALATAAMRLDIVHGIILMIEMGDLREGIRPENLSDVAQYVMHLPGVALIGIGANFACLSGRAPTASQMAALSVHAAETEALCGRVVETVSGGNSATLPWAFADVCKGRVNDLRLGEAILLGVDPLSGDQIAGMHTDAFTLIAEVIETDAIPEPSNPVDPVLTRLRIASNTDNSARLILALGHQDTDIAGLSMPHDTTVIGATSDHLVIACTDGAPPVGSEIRFQMNYSALMQAMSAPDIEQTMLHDRRSHAQHLIQDPPAHLNVA